MAIVNKGMIRTLYMKGVKPAGIAEQLDLPLRTVQYHVQQMKLPTIKRKLDKEAKERQLQVERESREQLAAEEFERARQEQEELSKEHYKWQKEVLTVAKDRLSSDVDSRIKLSSYMANAEAIDRLARKTFGLDDKKQVTDHQRNIAIMISVKPPERLAAAPSKGDDDQCLAVETAVPTQRTSPPLEAELITSEVETLTE